MKFLNKIWQFLREARSEFKKVTWPTKKDTTRYTLIVVVLSLAVAFFLGLWDFVFTWLLNRFII